jgi:hypothetical protein
MRFMTPDSRTSPSHLSCVAQQHDISEQMQSEHEALVCQARASEYRGRGLRRKLAHTLARDFSVWEKRSVLRLCPGHTGPRDRENKIDLRHATGNKKDSEYEHPCPWLALASLTDTVAEVRNRTRKPRSSACGTPGDSCAGCGAAHPTSCRSVKVSDATSQTPVEKSARAEPANARCESMPG